MKLDLIPVQTALINDIQAHTFSPSMRVNCATLGRLFNVSRTSIKRYVDAGKIQLDANGLADPKQAAQSVLESATAGRTKAKFFKTQVNERTAVELENGTLKIQLDGMKANLIEVQAALIEAQAAHDQWCNDYIQLENTIEAFIELLATDNELQKAVKQGNGAILQNAFDDLLELEND